MANAEPKQETLTTKFKVVMSEYDDAVFATCEGLESEIDVVFVPEGGRGDGSRALRGNPKVNRITFSRGILGGKSGKKTVFDWFLEVSDSSKPLKRQTLTIQLLDAGGKAVRSWKVQDAWPCRWVGPLLGKDASELTAEFISFAHEGITN